MPQNCTENILQTRQSYFHSNSMYNVCHQLCCIPCSCPREALIDDTYHWLTSTTSSGVDLASSIKVIAQRWEYKDWCTNMEQKFLLHHWIGLATPERTPYLLIHKQCQSCTLYAFKTIEQSFLDYLTCMLWRLSIIRCLSHPWWHLLSGIWLCWSQAKHWAISINMALPPLLPSRKIHWFLHYEKTQHRISSCIHIFHSYPAWSVKPHL